MRHVLGILHRWMGLFVAVFLFISGLTGAFISWDHELDGWLNPQLFFSKWQGEPRSALELADSLEKKHPELIVTFMPLALEEGEAFTAFVKPRLKENEQEVDFNQIALNPITAEEQGKRMWGEVSLARENLLPFLYKLHYTMHIPDVGGLELGMLFMGIVAIVWVIDCFVAISISFPSRRSWRKSFKFRWGASAQKLNFDLHRSGGVWVWLLLLVVSITSVSMNLGTQVVRPLVNAISPLSASPFDSQALAPYSLPGISREAIVAKGIKEAERLNIQKPAGGIFYSPDFNVYGVGFYSPGHSHGDGGLGNTWIYFNGTTGDYVGKVVPGEGSAGDIFMQAQFPLHSGRIIGIPGRIIMSFLGLAVAGLSLTGVIIWARKRRSRKVVKEKTLVRSEAAVLN